MLASNHRCLLPAVVLAFAFAVSVPLVAQVNGVPPSISSIGFGGTTTLNHVALPSVTSLKPSGPGNGWGAFESCCSNIQWPASPSRSGFSARRHRHRDHPDFPVGIVEPVYIPYAEPYVPETEEGPARDPAEDDSISDPQNFYPFAKPVRNYVERPTDSDDPDDQVDPQPSTVLVFKDGHQADVSNYAIVGDTLFDFSSGGARKILLADLDLAATQTVNDARGVDFRIPARLARQ
jgi:hypothetical protein